jgi:uncharacterized protein
MNRPIFHLSFPVHCLAEAKRFYRDHLGASVGRENDSWIDILLFEHQLTLHERPLEVLSANDRGVRHFGFVLDWAQWEALGAQLLTQGVAFDLEPYVSNTGTPREQGKMVLSDPSNNMIEIKSYRDFAAAMEQPEPKAHPALS